MKYQHPEAFCLMRYQDTLGNVEVIWNSRDGVTPFIVASRQGRESKHIDWQRDERAPDHAPLVGDRVFEDQTEECVRKWRDEYIDKWWDHPEHKMSENYPGSTKAEVLEELVRHDMAEFGGHAPQITEVTQEWLEARMPGKGVG